MSNNEQDVIASVIESQDTHGQLEAEVGQDEGTEAQESSTTDWETQAKYHQSEKDKLYARNQELEEGIKRFLESREQSDKPNAPERVSLKPDEFDPWEAYNAASSKSYKFRMQEMQETIDSAVGNAVGGIQAQQGRTNLRSDLASRGLDDQQIESFFEFADKHPSEYGLDNVLKMWQAVSQSPNTQTENPLEKIRQTQANPQSAGVLQGQQPKRKSEEDKMFEDVINAGGFGNRLP